MSSIHNYRYGYGHKQIRKRWAPKVRAGKVDCWRCGRRIPPGAKWDLGHMPGEGRHPEHTWCNRATVTHLKERLADPSGPTPLVPTSLGGRHSIGGEFDPTCRACRERGDLCDWALQIRALRT